MTFELIPSATSRDTSGFAVFSRGEAGRAHVMAHRMLDEERYELGHRLLGAWLGQHDGSGSRWTHLQWHMCVFEIATGKWDTALHRFETELLPVAASSFDALTDAPSMLWRLTLSAPRFVALDWASVRDTAIRRLTEPCDPYVELHCLLALAGAGDVANLDRWLRRRCAGDPSEVGALTRFGAGLRAFAAQDYALGAAALAAAASQVSSLGGSFAQNQLFSQIAALSWTRSQTMSRAA